MEEGVGKDEAIFRILKETIIASEPIRFEETAIPNNGNRKLPNAD